MTELIWEGKYIDGKQQSPVRVALPFQTIETVNESAIDRTRNLELFSSGRPTEWRNRLIWGDKKYVLPSLLPEFAGKVNLIYIDPPFDTGADFSYTATVPRSNLTITVTRPRIFGKKHPSSSKRLIGTRGEEDSIPTSIGSMKPPLCCTNFLQGWHDVCSHRVQNVSHYGKGRFWTKCLGQTVT